METTTLLNKDKTARIVSYTFSIEILRFFSFVSIFLLLAVGKVISTKFIFIDDSAEDAGTRALRGFDDADIAGEFEHVSRGLFEPYVDVKKGNIYSIFGFLHACSFVDYNPAKEFAAIVLPFFSLPMTLFVILNHFRIKLSVMNDESPAWLYTWSMYTTPLMIFIFQIVHLWFVNSPDAEFPDGMGFIGHYIPYATFQIGLAIQAVTQLYYCVALDKVPFGASKEMGLYYVYLTIGLTVITQTLTFTLLAGHPILDPKIGGEDGSWQRTLFKSFSNLYALVALFGPMIFSYVEMSDGDTNTFTIAHQ